MSLPLTLEQQRKVTYFVPDKVIQCFVSVTKYDAVIRAKREYIDDIKV